MKITRALQFSLRKKDLAGGRGAGAEIKFLARSFFESVERFIPSFRCSRARQAFLFKHLYVAGGVCENGKLVWCLLRMQEVVSTVLMKATLA